jgi:hypothetical protein
MLNVRLLFSQLAVLTVLLIVVLYGLAHVHLWDILWYSSIAHFLGGLWVALFSAWGLNVLRFPRDFFIYVAAALVFGICWEIFEFTIGATHFPVDTVDTVTDILMDIVGGMVGALFARYVWVRG